MSNKKWLLAAILAVIFKNAALAQVQMVYDTIPFEIVQDKFIFQAKIDGKHVRFILDTGGQNTIVADSADYYGVETLRTQTIADVNDATIQVRVGSVKNLRVGKWMNWNVGKVTMVPNNQFFRDLGVVGTIGGGYFANVCLSIDRRNRRFTISYPYRPPGISRNDGTEMEMGDDCYAIVPITIGSERIKALFDSGMSGFFALSANDYDKLNIQQGDVEKQHTGYGILYVGVSGIEKAISDSIYKAAMPVLTLPGGKEFHNVGSLVGQQSTSLVGQKLFDYGVVMLDYPRGLFYFFPYEKEPSDVEEITKVWNVRILPVTDHFAVVATIGDVALRIGDRVWKINGTDLTLENFSETFVNELLENSGKDTAEIVIGDNQKNLRKVTIKKI